MVRTLGECGLIGVESSPGIARRVANEARKLAAKNPAYHFHKPLVPVQIGFPGGLATTPAEVLHELGVATTLFTRSPFADVARHWAHLRYCATLSAANGILALSRDGDDVVYHHKVTQSEQLGIGFALVVAKRILKRQYPSWEFQAVDAELALRAGGIDGAGRVDHAHPTTMRPDYFLVGRRIVGGSAIKVVVLECKGTHGQEQFAMKQLATASVQVRTVQVGHAALPALMVACRLSPAQVQTYVLDPPGVENLWSGSEDEMDELLGAEAADVDLRSSVAPMPDTMRDDDKREDRDRVATGETATNPDEDDFRDELRGGVPTVVRVPEDRAPWLCAVLARTAAASALLFAGDDALAANYATPGQRRARPEHQAAPDQEPLPLPIPEPREAGSATASFTLAGMDFQGTRHVAALPDGRTLEMSLGMESGMRALLADGRVGRYLRRASQVRAIWQNTDRSRTMPEATSVNPDGTALTLRIV